MLKNFFKTSIRNLWKNKGFSLINISGLAVGMAGAILILLWIQNELSYDQFHAKKDRLYMAYNRQVFDGKLQCWANTPYPLGPALKLECPEVEATSRLSYNSFLLTVGEKHLNVHGYFVDSSFLTMFSLPLKEGNPNQTLKGLYSIVITEELAKKLFGEEDPMDKIIQIDSTDRFTVSGVLKDLPNNTTFNFEYLLSMDYAKKIDWSDDLWENNAPNTLVELKPNTNIELVNEKIRNIEKRHTNKKDDAEIFLHPISKWRLYSAFENGKVSGGRIEIVRLFFVIATFILLIACINFMNLSTARSEKRAKEVGIRKVSGATKIWLIVQFIGESILLAFVAGIIALLIVQFCLPAFNTLVKKQLFIEYANPWFWLIAISFVILTGIFAGSYPAFYLSSFKPVRILKGSFKAVNALVTPRKVLVILQFTFAVILIISTLIVQQQIKYTQERQSGYEKNNLIYILLKGDIGKNYVAIKNQLLSSGVAASITKTFSPMTQGWSDTWGMQWQGKDPNSKIDFDRYCVDENFSQTTGVKVIAGRDIDPTNYPTDSTAILLNESAVKAMGFRNPIGQIVKDNDINWHVVGVIKDFIIRSPYDPMRPMVIEGSKGWFNAMHIRFNPHQTTSQNLAKAEQIFKKYNPNYPFEYHFVDEEYEQKFNNEKQTKILATLFASLAIFISCLGLFGLATYMAENRIKEIGVRKVLGASVTNITTLLSKDFLKLVLVSILIAGPVSWWAMNKWLQGYNYRITISWWTFFMAGALALLIALMTVSYQAIKAAVANPVKTLRTE
jgi:ABC-type antimicrobial peptide transport system permease subunit